MLIDTHAHLYWDSYQNDLNEVLKRSKEAGVKTIINVGVDIEKSQEALKQAEEIRDLTFYSTIGIHPHEVLRLSFDKLRIAQGKPSHIDVLIHEDCRKLEQLYNSNPQKVVAVGECGLDFLFENNPDYNPSSLSTDVLKDLQRQLFQSQIDLAKKLNLPLIVHVRDDRSKNKENIECWLEALEMVKDHFGILHCYSGLPPITDNLPPNFLVSFAANLTYPKNDYLREAAKLLPLKKICLETDSPFLSPQSKRGQRNEPSSVLEIAQLIAELKGVSFEEVANQTTKNVKSLFKI